MTGTAQQSAIAVRRPSEGQKTVTHKKKHADFISV